MEIQNYVRWSEAFRTWIECFLDASNQGIDFFGSPIATKISEDWDYSWHYIQESETSFLTDDYTYSIYAKAGERDLLQLVSSWENPYDGMAVFDLTNGLVVKGNGQMTGEGDGWYRCGISSSVINSTAFNIRVMICIIGKDGEVTNDYQGDGKSGLNIYGAQFNPGLDMEPYSKTEGWPK